MEARESIKTTDVSLTRDLMHAARYYLGNRWALLALAVLAVILGLSFGGWGWLVAAGLAPILLSTLPCLIMCGLGYCMMCHSNKTQSAAPEATDSTTSSTALDVTKMDQSAVGGSICCNEQVSEAPSPQMKQLRPTKEKRDTHA